MDPSMERTGPGRALREGSPGVGAARALPRCSPCPGGAIRSSWRRFWGWQSPAHPICPPGSGIEAVGRSVLVPLHGGAFGEGAAGSWLENSSFLSF